MKHDAIIGALLRVIMKMPEPLPRMFLAELQKDCPELAEAVDEVCRRSVPFLNLSESRRTTMTNMATGGFRFSSVLITAETDDGQLICWPQFMLGRLPEHDLNLLHISLQEWIGVVRREIAKQRQPQRVDDAEVRVPPARKKEVEEHL